MKRYSLICPKCGEPDSVQIMAHEPSEMACISCEEEIQIEDVRQLVAGWIEFLADYDDMVAGEKKGAGPVGNEKARA